MEDRTPSKVEGAIERLNQDPYLLAAITAIPGVGGSITQVLTGIGQQIVQERNAKLFEQLSGHLATLDEQAIKRDYFETPEGFDLLIKALDESRRTRSDEKRDLIARILRGALTDESEEYSPEEYLYLISDLTVQELKVARSIYENRTDVGGFYATWHRRVLEELNIDDADLRVMLSRLEARGLCQALLTEEPTSSRVYRSPGFDKLMRFLELSG